MGRGKKASGDGSITYRIYSSVLTCPYFYGRITRQESEHILRERGGSDGLFLLRETISFVGYYAISICFKGNVHHYMIRRLEDGSYRIPEGRAFPDPITLTEFYQKHSKGFVTWLRRPCNRLPSQTPVAHHGFTYNQLKKLLHVEAEKKGVDIEQASEQVRDSLIKELTAQLHHDMPWYHGQLQRKEAEKRLKQDGYEEGKFLIRMRDDKKTYALSMMCDGGAVNHYFIDRKSGGCYAVWDGPRFTSLAMLVDHYHNLPDGLKCRLSQPCCRPDYSRHDYALYMSHTFIHQSSQCSLPLPPTIPLPPIPNGLSPKPRGTSQVYCVPQRFEEEKPVPDMFAEKKRLPDQCKAKKPLLDQASSGADDCCGGSMSIRCKVTKTLKKMSKVVDANFCCCCK